MKKLIFITLIFGLFMAGCSEAEINKSEPDKVDNTTSGSDDPEKPDNPSDDRQDAVSSEDASPLATIKDIEIGSAEADALVAFNKASFDINMAVARDAEKVVPGYDGNYSFSPVSTVMCLALIANSLDTPKDTDVAKVFGIGDIATFNGLTTKLLQYLPAPENGVDMRLANSIWYDNLYTVTDTFRKTMADNFATSVFGRDFTSSATVDDVNQWAARNTEGMITSIIEEIPALCDIMWFNALYFEGQWDFRFDRSLTKEAPFHGSSHTADVPMMTQQNPMDYAENNGLRMASIPFAGYSYILDIIMPTDAADKDYWRNIDYNTHANLVSASETAMVNLSLPRLQADNCVVLSDILIKMGFPLFDMTFNSMGLIGKFPSEAIGVAQKCAFELDEDGAKAAAVTGGLDISTGSTPQYRKVEMCVNRPFVYLIRERHTGSIVMMGHISNL